MRQTAPHRMFAPDLVGFVLLVGVVVWVWMALHTRLYETARYVPRALVRRS